MRRDDYSFGRISPGSVRISILFAPMWGGLAAQTPLPDTEEQRRRAQEETEERQRQQQAPKVRLPGGEALAESDLSLALPAESPSFRIDRFVLEVPDDLPAATRARGASRRRGDPFRFARTYLEQYAGNPIGHDGLNLIVRRLSRLILARGYTTTRVGLPEQDLGSRTLRLTLIPGIIRAIRFADPAPRGTWRSAFPVRPGDLLNLRDLEQGLEQLKRLPSQDVDIAIVPGARPGESDIVLTLRRGKPWRVGLSLDDSGVPATGQWLANLNLGWDNLLGWSDHFSAGLNHDVTSHRKGCGTRGVSLAYSVPWGYWTFSSSWNQTDYAQRVAGKERDHGYTWYRGNLEFRAGYLFHRGQASKDTLQLRTGIRQGRSFVDGTELNVQRRSHSYAELSLLHTQYLGRTQLDLAGSFRQGVPWFGAQPDLPPEASGGGSEPGPTSHYHLQTLDATLTVPLTLGGHGLQYSATVHGQHSADRLYASEYLSIGGRYTVRGFSGDPVLASDNGGFLRNDLECPLGRGASLYLGLDAGRVYGGNDATLAGHNLAGMVIGLKGLIKRGVSFNVFLGGPLGHPRNFPSQWPVLGIAATLQK